MASHARPRKSMILRSGISGLVVALLFGTAAGLLTSLGQTSEANAISSTAETVSAATYDPAVSSAPMPDLEVTVSQTADLGSQGVTINWTGAEAPTLRPQAGTGGENFLQIAQCWKEDPNWPGHPDRTSCQYGGFETAAALRENSLASLANVHANDVPFTAPGASQFDSPLTSIPFISNTGVEVSDIALNPTTNRLQQYYCKDNANNPVFLQSTCGLNYINVNSNQFFTKYTTNEIPWAPSSADGSGSVKFEMQTVMESPGLGCGAPTTANGVTTGQSCWLVIIPRGTSDVGEPYVTKSGLFWDAWKHHIAFELDFKPVGVRCQIGSAEKQIAGSELMAQAVAQWQPELCLGSTGATFVVSAGDESSALTSAAGTRASPLALTSRPYSNSSDPLVYAPVAISSVALTFTIDRQIDPDQNVPNEVVARNGLPFDSLKLNPRLVAKLLTNSYIQSLPFGAPLTQVGFIDEQRPGSNATNLTQDPEFLAINDPEWQYMKLNGAALGDFLIPQGRSDLAYQLWAYVMADPDARAFLAGTPDDWGMVVNSWYSSNAALNPSQTGLSLPRSNFPKADPIEKADSYNANTLQGTGVLNLVQYRPYVHDLQEGALQVLRGDGKVLGGWDTSKIPAAWGKSGRSFLGTRQVLAVTTAGASSRFQNVNAMLLNPAGEFVAPTTASMSAAVAAMTPTSNSSVYGFDFASSQAQAATTAYPLTMPIYAALNPKQSDAGLREVYAAFIRFAAKDGQTPGTEAGELPEGYAPLPASWVNQALQAASAIQSGIKPAAAVNLGTVSQGTYTTTNSVSSAPVVAPATTVAATGNAAGALSSGETPKDPSVGPLAVAVPAGFLSGAAAAAAVPLLSRRRLRLN
ncbi:hypothetical protein [Aurantimicrobium photophilum]|uniref:PBP domain-containing protein n=1 Tax=Aurantimicrobium photophilum TaxID=1987356 RepID=A0A2Z3RYX5_9MICO|nr:hypothetical protein [Aurantimicrobium photophilum]AWR21985.1 hypothetical protein AURMO_01395 [Aurantimicrobium photophilum]